MQLRKTKLIKVQKWCGKGACQIILNLIAPVLDLQFLKSSEGVHSTDAQSLIYEIGTKNVYDDFSKNKEIFNFSKYSAKL